MQWSIADKSKQGEKMVWKKERWRRMRNSSYQSEVTSGDGTLQHWSALLGCKMKILFTPHSPVRYVPSVQISIKAEHIDSCIAHVMCKLTVWICMHILPKIQPAFFSMYTINLLCRCFVRHSMWLTITRRRQLWWPSGDPWLCRYPLRIKSPHTYYVQLYHFSYVLARSRIVVLISTLIFTWRHANQTQDVLTQLSAEPDILSTSESGDTLAHRVRAFSVSHHPIQWPITVSMITLKHLSWDNYCLVSVLVWLRGGHISWGFVSQPRLDGF